MTLFNYRDMYATKFGLPLSARYKHDPEEVRLFKDEVIRQHRFSEEEAEGRALARLDSREYQRQKAKSFIVTAKHNWRRRVEVGVICFLLLLVILLSAKVAHGQTTTIIRGAATGATPANNATVTSVDANHKAIDVYVQGGGAGGGVVTQPTGTNLHMVCDSGCGGAASYTDASAFTFGTTAVNNISAVVDDVGTNTVAENSAGAVRMGSDRILFVKFSTAQPITLTSTTITGNVAVTEADGANVTLGARADAKSTATDTTPVTIMQVLKEISAMVQAPPSQAVTNAGTFATQSAITAASGSIASGALASGSIASGAVASGAVSSGAFASGSVSDGAVVTLGAKTDAKSTATDATSVTIMQVLKEISAMVQAPATTPASQSGTWTVQPGNTANTTPWLTTDSATSATGAAVPAKASYTGGAGSGATGGFVVGIPVGDTYKNINVSTATTTLLVTGVSGRQVRISAMHMITTLANNVALIEGTGATCGTGTAGMAGGTTAASGYNLAANGGIAFGSGLGTVIQTATTGDSVCVVTSAATQLSGGLQYTIY